MRFFGLTMDIDAIDIYLEKAMKEKFEKLISKEEELSKSKFNSKYSLLTSPVELSYITTEEFAVLKLAKEIKKQNLVSLFDNEPERIVMNLKENHPKIFEGIESLVKKFWWTSLGWRQVKGNNFRTYVSKLKGALEKDIEKEIKSINNSIKKVKSEKKQLAIDFNFDDEMKFYLRLFEKYVLLHDYRKEDQMRGVAIMDKFLFEIKKIGDIRYEDLVWAWPDEIKNYLREGVIDLEKIRDRKGAFFTIIEKDNIRQLTGEEAIKTRKKVLMPDQQNIHNFEGMGVSLGKVVGRVRVCHSSADSIKKVRKGDILVASMTLPDYVPAMKKAVAIVTDEGGVTCHAAIVSRELKLPCIVGTKIATKVLNDGDLVEVNANHGVVRIIKTAKSIITNSK
ncbi:hypothetical protein GOV14_05490 [Candidatus Pacearchaeota archaeon]|nr:hypothetical protein [Candidatus Pacearchaeota archaeon]